jgi:hypothetical protein
MAPKDMRIVELETVLREFVDDVESSGGVLMFQNGIVTPEASQDWSDIGATYLNACKALGKTPMIDDMNSDMTLEEFLDD